MRAGTGGFCDWKESFQFRWLPAPQFEAEFFWASGRSSEIVEEMVGFWAHCDRRQSMAHL